MKTLNNFKNIKDLDKSGMAQDIAHLPCQFFEAEKKAKEKISASLAGQAGGSALAGQAEGGKTLEEFKKVEKIVICGMGGSGIAGEITKSLVEDQLKVPLSIIQDWHLPLNIDQKTLVILVSFSGETREVLNCLNEAKEKKARIFFISQKKNLDKSILNFSFDFSGLPRADRCCGQPRAALGFLIMPLLVLLEKLNFIDLKKIDLKNSLEKLKKFNKNFLPEIETEKNQAKLLAFSCFEYLPYIIAPEKYKPIAKRFKTQINENAKSFAVFETLPEASHHLVESHFPEVLKDQINFLIIEDKQIDKENQKTIEIFKKLLIKNNFKFETISPLEGNLFTRLISLILIGDWLSFYLAILNQTDPTTTDEIKWFKKNYAK